MRDLPACVAPAFERHFLRDGEPELPDLDLDGLASNDEREALLDPEDVEVLELLRDVEAWERRGRP